MAVLFDPTDEFVRSVLDRAKMHGEITLADLESIVEAAIEAKGSFDTDDIGDTVDALAAMGIEIDDGLTQEQKDSEFDQAMTDWVDKHGLLPSLTPEGWDMLARATARKKAARNARPDPSKPSPEREAAARREVLSKRTFVQNAFAHLGPRVRSERTQLDADASEAGHFEDSQLGDFIGDPADVQMGELVPDVGSDAVGEEEPEHLGDFLDGPDGSPPDPRVIHFHYDFPRMARRREAERRAEAEKASRLRETNETGDPGNTVEPRKPKP